MTKRALIVAGCIFLSVVAIAATYTNSWTDGIFTGNGYQTTDIALPTWGANQNATVQISRNGTGDGGGQGSALDVYASGATGAAFGGGYAQRWWIDCAVDGGKCAVITIDYGGNMKLLTSFTVSGSVVDHNGTGQNLIPLLPTTDSYMIGVWNDVANGGNIYSCVNGYANDGDSNAQAFIAMDGHFVDAGIGENHPNVRFAIDGNSGKLRWTNSISTSYNGATWDATLGRVAAHILGDSTTSLQPLHLDQPATKNDISGTISIVAAANGMHTFATAYNSAPSCVATPNANPLGVSYWMTTTATAVKVNLNAAATLAFTYHCDGNPN